MISMVLGLRFSGQPARVYEVSGQDKFEFIRFLGKARLSLLSFPKGFL